MFLERSRLFIMKNRKDLCSLLPEPVVLPKTSSSVLQKASLTVEAACVLPLFLYAMLALLYFFLAVSVEGSVLCSLQQTGKELAVYSYACQKGEGDSKLVSGSLSAAYVKGKVIQRLEQEQLNTSVIHGGAWDIDLHESSFLEQEMIDLKANYRLQFPQPLLHIGRAGVTQRVKVRAWLGRTDRHTGTGTAGEQNQKVYITATGTVYHQDPNCTHLRLSVQQVDKDSVRDLRNANGGKYYCCERCPGNQGQSVYITETGDRYHASLNCSGLKRTVTEAAINQLSGYRPCQRCGG